MSERYRTIVADPPWPYDSPGAMGDRTSVGRVGAGSRVRYGAIELTALYAILLPAHDDAHLYLWTTNRFMVEAHQLARAWDFAPKTICTWVKMQENGQPSRKAGYYFRGATEHFLFCVRGSLPLRTAEALPTAYLWPRTQHSIKPDAFYDLVEQASPGPYVELFARRARFGWDYLIGDQALGGVAA